MTFDTDRRAPHDRIAFIVTASWWEAPARCSTARANRWPPSRSGPEHGARSRGDGRDRARLGL